MWSRDISQVRQRACRTLSEAFPQDWSYACALERPARPYPRGFWRMFAAVAIAGLIVVGCQS